MLVNCKNNRSATTSYSPPWFTPQSSSQWYNLLKHNAKDYFASVQSLQLVVQDPTSQRQCTSKASPAQQLAAQKAINFTAGSSRKPVALDFSSEAPELKQRQPPQRWSKSKRNTTKGKKQTGRVSFGNQVGGNRCRDARKCAKGQSNSG